MRTSTTEALAREAVKLEPADRLRLVEAILQSLESVDSEVEKRWAAESEARLDAHQQGKLDAVDWDEIKRRPPA